MRESSPVMDSRVASWRPAFWKSKNIAQAIKFGPHFRFFSTHPSHNFSGISRNLLYLNINFRVRYRSQYSVFLHWSKVQFASHPWKPLRNQNFCAAMSIQLLKNQVHGNPEVHFHNWHPRSDRPLQTWLQSNATENVWWIHSRQHKIRWNE